MALAKKPIKAGLNLGLKGYENIKNDDPKRPNVFAGQGWVGVTKANMSEYNF
jgi:simple sugar transport system substrate-binding protein